MLAAYFTATDGGFVPQPHARGPWSDAMLHGRLLGGLAARAIEAVAGGEGFTAARLTVDLFRAAPLDTVVVEAGLVRDGRRIRVADAVLSAGGVPVARAGGVLLRTGPRPPGTVWQPDLQALPAPGSVPVRPPPEDQPHTWEVRAAHDWFGAVERGEVWSRELIALVDGEPLTPFVRAALAADMASPLANSGDDGLHFINADYSLSLAREPHGEWIGLQAAQHLAGDGVALGACTMFDVDGPIGTSTTVALANPPLRPAG